MNESKTIQSVALIGAGSMGARMAKRLLAGGVNTIVCDTRQETRETFAKLGAQTTASASDCAQADLIVVMVPSDEALRAVTIGDNGVSSRNDGVKPKIICVMSTTMPGTARELAQQCQARGIALVDAPVSGGPARAEDGTLSIFFGGSDEAFEQLQPILGLMGKNIYHCGDVGSACAVKIINNLICITNIYITGEAFEIATDLGVDLNRLAPILDVSTGRNFISADLGQSIKQFKEWGGSDESFAAIGNILKKDLGFALELIQPDHINSSLAKRVLEYAKSDDPHLFNRWRQIADTPTAQ